MIDRLRPPKRVIGILGGARDFHAVDWFHAVRRDSKKDYIFITDLLESEGLKNLLVGEKSLKQLFIIDRILFERQSNLGHAWRNIIKLVVAPVQALLLLRIFKKHGCTIIHAHPMYYMMLCWMAHIPFMGTPQGAELLSRPNKSYAYRFFARRILRAAKYIVVDSRQMSEAAYRIGGVHAKVIQNGINVELINNSIGLGGGDRNVVLSLRGMEPIYRIEEIIAAAYAGAIERRSLTFVYPFFDENYSTHIKKIAHPGDHFLGRLDKMDLFRLMSQTILAISIPISDSSPRSVYEAIFCGCCVAVTFNPWIELLPSCMRSRVIVVDLLNKNWLFDAYNKAVDIIKTPFIASNEALDLFDENRSLLGVIEECY